MTGFLKPKSSETQSCFQKRLFCILGRWDYPSGCNLILAEVSFRVRDGAPQVRSLRKFKVNLYRRTPPLPGLSIEQVLVVVRAWWLPGVRRKVALFPFRAMKTETRALIAPRRKTPCSPTKISLPQAIQVRYGRLQPGNYRPSQVIQGKTQQH